MATWAKIKLFWQTMLGSTSSTLNASSTATGHDVKNLYNMLLINKWMAANANDPCSIVFDAGGEQVINKDFESGNTAGWSAYIGGAAAATFTASSTTPIAGAYSGYANITNGGALSDIQIYQVISLTAGKAYQVFFKAKASAARVITVKIMQQTAPYNVIKEWTASLTTSTQSFTYAFTTNSSTNDARIDFYLGGDNNSVWLDDISFGNAHAADFIAIASHNLDTIGGYMLLQQSFDGATYTDVIDKRLAGIASADFLQEAEILVNRSFECWGNGSSSAPNGWSFSGAGAAIARESSDIYSWPTGASGKYSAKVISAAADAFLSTPVVGELEYYKSKIVTFGVWTKCSSANMAAPYIYDGSSTFIGTYHPGNGGWSFLTVTTTLGANISQLKFGCYVKAGTVTAYFDEAKARVASSLSASDACDLIQPLSVTRRFWRVYFTGHAVAPDMAICIWGNKTELDYASSEFDPHEQEAQVTVNRAYGGAVAGIHTKYTDRRLSFTIADADADLYAKIQAWRETHGMKQLFIAWETANSPADVWLVYPDPHFRHPLKLGGAYRDIILGFKGAI